ncbi:MucB/RseB C-terminal domain-containing protein [Haliea sp. E1-2-M8]|uniref:MucB/RseB C-terminal domain-containing protein n=1 Tax=Haliea sp. E1-2-M8 TaxID=3064706 RepID=UPI0027230709|nr:MucB/RseB C-terminal domain-containing protein [Haliea sp. E1-2-M8]MDO8860763.1 MucB/RseB C-terminal domain-containing protein [Haliea sp. E1-2-M8]
MITTRSLFHALAVNTALLACIFIATPAPAATCSETDAEALGWLAKMSRSYREVAYQGVVTFQRGGDLQVMQIARSVEVGESSELLTRLTGQGAQVVRAAHPLDCTHPGQQLLQLGDQLPASGCGMAEYYRFQVGEGDRIAGRQAVRVGIQPRDMYRYGYVLELDRETGLLLGISTLGRGDQLLERFQFADLHYGEPESPQRVVETVHPARHPHPDVADEGPALTASWSVSWLPRGFTPTDSAEAVSPRRTYTDGLAVFSVFLEQLSRELRPGEGVVREGSTTSYTRGMSLAGQPMLVTVVGEVPLNTARMVADSIRLVR